jgi:NitT/TauT family transport system substrate-binding protein
VRTWLGGTFAIAGLAYAGGYASPGLLVAADKGYFAEVGIDVEMQQMAPTANIITALGLNQLDVGIGGTGATITTFIARGVEIKITAGVNEARPGTPNTCWVARKDLVDSGEFRALADLRGKRVAGQAQGTGSSNDIYLDRLLRQASVGLQEVEIISMSFPEINTAMANRAIDVGWQSEPGITLGTEQGLFEPFSCIGELVPGYQSTYMFFSQQFAANRSAAERFMLAYVRGTREYDDAFFKDVGTEAVVGVLTRRTDLRSPEVWRKMAPVWVTPDALPNLAQLVSDQEFYVQEGYLTQRADLASLVDSSFAEQAIQRLGRYQP